MTSPLPSLRAVRLAIFGLVLVVSSCASDERPSVDEWLPTWQNAVALVPDANTLIENGQDGLCEERLVSVRALRLELVPSPDSVIDPVVDEWINEAEGAFFDCPPTQDPTYESTMAELARLQAEIDSVLEVDRSG